MKSIQYLPEVEHIDHVATNLSTLLKSPKNRDIEIHFSKTVQRYGGTFKEAADNLREAASICETGKRAHFIAFWGTTAVGMSIVTNQVEAPEGVDSAWPNISGFVLNPYRQMGLGRMAMQRRMEVVDSDFGGHAWTQVRHGNTPAEKLVLEAGFEKTDIPAPGGIYQSVYLYSASTK